jgi:hypothetical protein
MWDSATWLNRIDRIPISTKLFFGSSTKKNFEVKRAWIGAILGWVTDQEVGPGCAWVRTKYIEKTSVGLWGHSTNPSKLAGVTPLEPVVGQGVTNGIRVDPHCYAGMCESVADMWSMARHGICVDTGRIDVCQEGTFLVCAWSMRAYRSSKGGCMWDPSTWLNRIDRIPIWASCNFFSGSSSKKTLRLRMLGLEQYEDEWPTEKWVPGTHKWEQSAQKSLVLVWGQSRNPSKLAGVTPSELVVGRGVTC